MRFSLDLALIGYFIGLSEEKKKILEDYHKSHNDEIIDMKLLISMLSDIHSKADLSEAILVFLPGILTKISLCCVNFILKS